MEERWKLQDMTREVKRKKMRGEFKGPTDVSSEMYVKIILKHQKLEEKWRKEDTERIKKRIEYRKKHPRKDVEDRRWIALTKGTDSDSEFLRESFIRGISEPRIVLQKDIKERGRSLPRGSTF